jgi:ABC-2 type transport system permease protein
MIMNKYICIARTNFINSLAYFQDTIWSSVFIALILFIFVNLWTVVYGSNLYIEGFTIAMMLWYLVMTESIVTSQSKVLEDIGDEIVTGNITNYLSKPYNYLIYKYAFSIGKSILKFFITFAAGGIVVYALLGPIHVSLWSIPLILLIAFLAITLNFIIMAFLGVFALWFEDSRSLAFVYSKIVFTVGGMLVPLEIFPKWLYTISISLPFSYVAYFPAKLFVDFNIGMFVNVLLMELFWITIFIIVTALAYKVCMRKVSINGG